MIDLGFELLLTIQLPEAICIRLVQGIFGGAVGVVSGTALVPCNLVVSGFLLMLSSEDRSVI